MSADRFGKNVRLLRELLGIDQAELARRCGVSVSAISHLECGRRDPSLTTVYRVKDAIGCAWPILMDGPTGRDWKPRTGGHIDTDVPPGRTDHRKDHTR